jgi:DNA polymerase-3 subunit epsilon
MNTLSIPQNCVVFDTETTGFSPDDGDKLVEIGAVRMRDGLPTKETFHTLINPLRTVPEAATKVHGHTTEILSSQPLFEEVAQDFLDFVGDMPLTAHNAPFDMRFINAELALLGLPVYPEDRFVDTVPIARKRFPGAQANLDALCRRFKISLVGREKHGALVDSELLAEVCVELMGGRQSNLFGAMSEAEDTPEDTARPAANLETFILKATDEERARHAKEILAKLGENSIWARLEGAA